MIVYNLIWAHFSTFYFLFCADVSEVMFTCLRTVVQTIANRDTNPNILAVVANMIALFNLMTEDHFEQYIMDFKPDTQAGRENMIEVIMEVLAMFYDLIQHNVYEDSWNSMIMLQNSVILKALCQFANPILKYLINPFDFNVWNTYLLCAIAFITQPALQVEKFTENKRTRILSQYKDMRKQMGLETKKMWSSLGQHKIKFIPEIVGPFLEMTLIPETELRKATIPIFFDMMQCEYYSQNGRTNGGSGIGKQNFNELEDAIIQNLDYYMTDIGAGDEHYKDLFKKILISLCEQHTALKETGKEFVSKVGIYILIECKFKKGNYNKYHNSSV